MRELVDQGKLGRPPDHALCIELVQRKPPMARAPVRYRLEPFGESGGLGPVVRLQVADHDVVALVLCLLAFLEHAVCLADAGGRAEQYPVAPAHASPRVLRQSGRAPAQARASGRQ